MLQHAATLHDAKKKRKILKMIIITIVFNYFKITNAAVYLLEEWEYCKGQWLKPSKLVPPVSGNV